MYVQPYQRFLNLRIDNMRSHSSTSPGVYVMLICLNLLYACESIFTKYASLHPFLSYKYCLGIAGAIGVLGLYAIGWQQVLKGVEVSTAYMFKGTSLIFVMLLAYIFLGEAISMMNIVGAAVIITGITLFARE